MAERTPAGLRATRELGRNGGRKRITTEASFKGESVQAA